MDCMYFISSRKHLFYLSFENGLCTDYVTEKFFFALGKIHHWKNDYNIAVSPVVLELYETVSGF